MRLCQECVEKYEREKGSQRQLRSQSEAVGERKRANVVARRMHSSKHLACLVVCSIRYPDLTSGFITGPSCCLLQTAISLLHAASFPSKRLHAHFNHIKATEVIFQHDIRNLVTPEIFQHCAPLDACKKPPVCFTCYG